MPVDLNKTMQKIVNHLTTDWRDSFANLEMLMAKGEIEQFGEKYILSSVKKTAISNKVKEAETKVTDLATYLGIEIIEK